MHHQSIKRKSSKKKRSPRTIRIPMSIRSRITNVAKKVKQAVSDELKDLDRII